MASRSPLFEIALVLVRFDYIARFIVSVNHGIICAAVKLSVANRLIQLRIPEPTERQPIGN